MSNLSRESRRAGLQPLRERIGDEVKAKFGARIVANRVADFAPDFVIHSDDRIGVIDISTGDPTLPLPASANTRMLNLKHGAAKLGLRGVVVPVLVTNYLLDPSDRTELEAGGVKIITIKGPTYDSKALSDQLDGILA
jgi:hypothetical protein